MPFAGYGLKSYPDEILTDHIRFSTAQGYAEVEEMPAISDTLLVVGSGPSVRGQVRRIRRMSRNAAVLAVKSAHDWLCEKGITPDLALAMDPRPTIGDECYRRRNDTTMYILASQCHPQLFQHLAECRVMLCHSDCDLGRKLLPDQKTGWVWGGCTSGLRALNLAYMLGFRDIVLFGYDCCHEAKLRKISGEPASEWKQVEVQIDGKSFFTDEHMAQQAYEFPAVVQKMPGARIRSYGRGIITQLLKGVQ